MNETSITDKPQIAYSECYRLPFLSLFHADCMEIMKQYPDKYFDLAIVDPPYGIGLVKTEAGNWGIRKENKGSIDENTQWDFERPTKEYFEQLFRVSKDQIIWGGNYFIDLIEKPTSCFLIWDKINGESYFADAELAWTSFNTATRIYKKKTVSKNRIHICEKPVELYEYILNKYSDGNEKILDTHFGSGSIALAVDKANRLDKKNIHLTGIEIGKKNINKAIKRISESIKQGALSF